MPKIIFTCGKNSKCEINVELKLNDINFDILQSFCIHSSYFFTQTIALPYYAKLKENQADEKNQMAGRIYILEMHLSYVHQGGRGQTQQCLFFICRARNCEFGKLISLCTPFIPNIYHVMVHFLTIKHCF